MKGKKEASGEGRHRGEISSLTLSPLAKYLSDLNPRPTLKALQRGLSHNPRTSLGFTEWIGSPPDPLHPHPHPSTLAHLSNSPQGPEREGEGGGRGGLEGRRRVDENDAGRLRRKGIRWWSWREGEVGENIKKGQQKWGVGGGGGGRRMGRQREKEAARSPLQPLS